MTELDALKLVLGGANNEIGRLKESGSFIETEAVAELEQACQMVSDLIDRVETGDAVQMAGEVMLAHGFASFVRDDLEGLLLMAGQQGWDLSGFTEEQLKDALRAAQQGIRVDETTDALASEVRRGYLRAAYRTLLEDPAKP